VKEVEKVIRPLLQRATLVRFKKKKNAVKGGIFWEAVNSYFRSTHTLLTVDLSIPFILRNSSVTASLDSVIVVNNSQYRPLAQVPEFVS